MTLILTASGWGQRDEDFLKEIKQSFSDNKVKVHSLQWHKKIIDSRIGDILDTRNGAEIIKEVSEKIISFYDQDLKEKEKLIFISFSTGARIVEESLSLISGLEAVNNPISHIMLSPNLKSKDTLKIGKYAASAIGLGLTTLASTKLSGKSRALVGTLGLMSSMSFVKGDKIVDKVSDELDENFKFVKIRRYVFLGENENNFDNYEIPNVIYYQGQYKRNKVGLFRDENENQSYKELNNKKSKEINKIEIIKKIIK